MNDEQSPASEGSFFPTGFSGEFVTFTPLNMYLTDHLGWNPIVALSVTGALLLLTAIALRMLLYWSFRLSGQVRYTAFWQTMEGTFTFILFALGFVAGYFGFGNFFSAILTGGCWAFVFSGTALKALTDNEPSHYR